MKIDIRPKVTIPIKYAQQYNKIAENIQSEFNDAIADAGKKYKNKLEWWLLSVSSRNIFASPLFHYCCGIALVQELLKNGEQIECVVTDSPAQKRIIESWLFKHRYHVSVKIQWQSRYFHFKKLFLNLGHLFYAFFKHIWQYIQIKINYLARRELNFDEPVTLIDTFVVADHVEQDRYYPGMLDKLSQDEKKYVFFIPTLFGINFFNVSKTIKKMYRCSLPYLFKEEYLRLTDYFFAIFVVVRSFFVKVKNVSFCRVDISLLLIEEIRLMQGSSSAFDGMLNSLFAGRLKKQGVKVKLVIDWFENQVVDKGWNLGFRKFYPEIEHVGYQGFITVPTYLCTFPTSQERVSNVIPKKIAVIGSMLINSVNKFCPELNVEVAPAFRYSHLYETRKFYPDNEKFVVLVALPIFQDQSIEMLNTLADSNFIFAENTHFWIKPHPAMGKKFIKKLVADYGLNNFVIVQGQFYELLEKSNVLLGSASSTCMESIAKGVPVIVFGNNHGLTHNPIPSSINRNMWKICYSSEDFSKAFEFYYDNREDDHIKEFEKLGLTIRNDFFKPITSEGVKTFLRLSSL